MHNKAIALLPNGAPFSSPQQVAQCSGKYKSTPELEECLLPNRRVEVQLLGVRAP